MIQEAWKHDRRFHSNTKERRQRIRAHEGIRMNQRACEPDIGADVWEAAT